MLTKLDYKYSIKKKCNLSNESVGSELYPNVEEKIDELFNLINKYFEGVETSNEDLEMKVIQDSVKYELTSLNDSIINEDWAFVKVCKK